MPAPFVNYIPVFPRRLSTWTTRRSMRDCVRRWDQASLLKQRALIQWNEKRLANNWSVLISEFQVGFATPHFTVPKMGTDAVRIVGDFRGLNRRIVKRQCDNLNVEMFLFWLHQFEYVVKIDIQSAFDHVPILPECRRNMAYYIDGRCYAYVSGGQGFINFPSYFSSFMAGYVRDMNWFNSEVFVGNCQDDIFLFSHEPINSDIYINWLFQHGLPVNEDKLQSQDNMIFLGYHITRNIICFPDIQVAGECNDWTHLKQKLLGSYQYYAWAWKHQFTRKFMLSFLPEVKKELLAALPPLIHTVTRRPIVQWHCDASIFGFGFCGLDVYGKVKFASSRLMRSDAWKRYPQIKREAVALEWALTRITLFAFLSESTDVYVDSQPLGILCTSDSALSAHTFIGRIVARIRKIILAVGFNLHFVARLANSADCFSRPHPHVLAWLRRRLPEHRHLFPAHRQGIG